MPEELSLQIISYGLQEDTYTACLVLGLNIRSVSSPSVLNCARGQHLHFQPCIHLMNLLLGISYEELFLHI